MSGRYKRHFLKEKEAKMLFKKASKRLKVKLEEYFTDTVRMEIVETDFGEIYLINNKPVFFKKGENVYPTLLFKEIFNLMPKVVVDMGAVRHICNGANIMAPGIVRFEGKFEKDDLVSVTDERYGKVIAVGEIAYNSDEVAKVKRGVVVKNLHFVGDKIWRTAKNLGGTLK